MAAETSKEKKVKINIHKEKNKAGDVFVGVNGVSYIIKRGVDVDVPESVCEVLKQSISMEMDPDTNEMIEVPSYPFSVKG